MNIKKELSAIESLVPAKLVMGSMLQAIYRHDDSPKYGSTMINGKRTRSNISSRMYKDCISMSINEIDRVESFSRILDVLVAASNTVKHWSLRIDASMQTGRDTPPPTRIATIEFLSDTCFTFFDK